MPDELAVDDGDPLVGGYAGQCGGDLIGVRGVRGVLGVPLPGDGADVEAERAQPVRQG
ncbi:hypothetical protein [Streptomyces sp. MJM1172]|uniref:hypothetical protein n=1 Tax=Streptomyces sp. MJM1172 TaxID=1703926 RepID=UPI001F519F6C|nr:hypothetical protein [Streptomyces sp. MJM1172]